MHTQERKRHTHTYMPICTHARTHARRHERKEVSQLRLTINIFRFGNDKYFEKIKYLY